MLRFAMCVACPLVAMGSKVEEYRFLSIGQI